MKTKPKQNKKPTSQPTKLRDLPAQKNPIGGNTGGISIPIGGPPPPRG